MSPRWRRALAACTASLAIAACPLTAAATTAAPGMAPTTVAHSARAGGLPPIGAEVPSSVFALNCKFQYQRNLTVDFRGAIKQRVEVNADDPFRSVRLRTLAFRVNGEGDNGARVTFEMNNADTEARSALRLTQNFPPKYEERDEISFTATIELPGREPVVLVTREPMVVTATITQYPARGGDVQVGRAGRPGQAGRPEHAGGPPGGLRPQARRPVDGAPGRARTATFAVHGPPTVTPHACRNHGPPSSPAGPGRVLRTGPRGWLALGWWTGLPGQSLDQSDTPLAPLTQNG
ncbi:hypothetical protein Scel_10550 [Streptomyces cellostaticus]|nr:hypothetical protein Scel_10550 [Streptomyces cellostaticus]